MVIREEDYTAEVVKYLKENIKRGYKLDDLKFLLQKQKYSKSIIERASQIVTAEMEKERQASIPIVEQAKLEPIKEEKKESIFKQILNFFKRKK